MSEATASASAISVNLWNDERDVLTRPDGSQWGTRRIIDPQRRQKGETRFPNSRMYFPLLKRFSRKVRRYTAKCKPHTIRKMVVESPRADGPSRIGVWHLGDIAVVNEWRANADRQQAAGGKFKGQWFLSPARVVEKLGVDISLISVYRRKGISWMPKIAVGCKAGKKRKPITALFMLGNGRYEYFWLESDVDEFAKAREERPDTLPAGYVSVGDAKKKQIGAAKGLAEDEIGYIEIALKKKEKVAGKREFDFTTIVRAITQEDLDVLREERNNPVPPGMMTVQQIAAVFRMDGFEVLRWIREGCKELGGAKLAAEWGTILCHYRTSKGKLKSQLREGWRVKIARVKRIWSVRNPETPWPITNHADAVLAALDVLGAKVEASIIVATEGIATTKTLGNELHGTLAKQHAETHAGQGRIEDAIGKHAENTAPDKPTINYHGGLSCSFGGQSPVKISVGEDSIIRAFLGKDPALNTRELEGHVSNVSEVMKKLAEKFPGAVRTPADGGGKGSGYFVRVKDARK